MDIPLRKSGGDTSAANRRVRLLASGVRSEATE